MRLEYAYITPLEVIPMKTDVYKRQVLLFQCKYRCVKLNMLKLAPKTEQDSNGTFHPGAFLLPRWPPGHLKAHI